MKRLVLVLAAPFLVAACGGANPSAPPHIVSAGAGPDPAAVAAPVVTLPPITAPPAPAARAAVVRVSRSAPRPRVNGDVWGALARCESGGNPRAVSSTGKYFGAFQFSLSTWQSLGYSGNPIDHPYETQLAAAQKLQARSGWGQWPVCARKLGLL